MLANNTISQKAHKNTTLFKFIFLRRNIVHFLDIVFLFSYHSSIPSSGIIINWNRNLQKLEHNLQDPSITSRNTCIPSRNQVTLIQRDRRGNARIWSDNLQLACVQPPTSSYNPQLPHGRHGHGDHGKHGGSSVRTGRDGTTETTETIKTRDK